MNKTIFAILFSLLILAPERLLADNSSDPQAAAQDLYSQAESFKKESTKLPEPKPKEKPEINAEQQKEDTIDESKGPKFVLKQINLEGNTLFSREDLDQYIILYLNKEQTLGKMKSLARLITHHYQSYGFGTSRAYVPPQSIENSIVTIKIVEGKVGKISVEGNKYYSKEIYEKALDLKSGAILNFKDLEQGLDNINQSSNRKAKAYLAAGVEPLTSDIVLKTEENNPLYIYYTFNNHGTKLTHRARNGVGVNHTNITGHDDTLNAAFSLAEEDAFRGESLAYSFPIQKTGTTLSLATSYSDTRLVKHFKPLDITGESLAVMPEISQNFIKKTDFQLNGILGFEYMDSKTSISQTKLNVDRLRILKLGPQMIFSDPGGQTSLNGQFHLGIPDFLGGSKDHDVRSSVANAGGDFTYYTADISRIQRFVATSYLTFKAGGQWTSETLPSSERFRGGGAYSVRGYPESDALGDYGYNFSAELNAPVYFLPKDWQVPFSNKKWVDSVRMVGFLDGASTYLRERVLPTDEKNKFLLGTGVGIRIDLGRNFSLQADLGFPVGDDSSDKNNKQFHIEIRSSF